MTTVLVIGGSGKTGREVTKALSAHSSVNAKVGSRDPAALAEAGLPKVRFVWEEETTWPSAAAGADAIYLVKPKTADPAATVSAFLDHCPPRARIVLLSEIAAEFQAKDADELRVERIVEAGKQPWTILRPNWFMQNFVTPGFFLESIKRDGAVTIPTNGQAVSFVDTRDIADVAVAALLDEGHEGRHYTLTGPDTLTFAEALSRIGAVAGYAVKHIDPPLDEHLAKSAAAGMASNSIAYYRRIYSNIANGHDAIISPDIHRVTGHPARGFAEFLQENRKAWT
jgi:uncharacterized protein YbjT (DUF2867 family)